MDNFLKIESCKVCNSKQIKFSYQIHWKNLDNIYKKHIGNLPKIMLCKCVVCNYAFANPQITNEALKNYYLEFNSSFYDKGLSVPHDFINRKNKNLLKYINKRKSEGNILEVGCGMGFLLNEFDKKKWNRHGIEPSIFASEYAKSSFGLDIINGFLDADSYAENFFDVVMVFDVIEHVANPTELMQNIFRITKKGGIVVIGTGNIESLNARIARGYWEYLETWEHISLFSPPSLKQLLEKNGFKEITLYKKSHNGTLFENLWLLFRSQLKNIIKLIIRPIKKYKLNFPICFDHIVVIASK